MSYSPRCNGEAQQRLSCWRVFPELTLQLLESLDSGAPKIAKLVYNSNNYGL